MNESVPLAPAFGTTWKLPSACNVNVPLVGAVTTSAVRASPSLSWSLARTPGAATVMVAPAWARGMVSSRAEGRTSTMIVTVVGALNARPSPAL